MATISPLSRSTASSSSNHSNYEIEYSPSENNSSKPEPKNAYIASAMVINAGYNSNGVNGFHSPPSVSTDSGIDTTSTPNTNSTTSSSSSVNNLVNNFSNLTSMLSPLHGKESLGFFTNNNSSNNNSFSNNEKCVRCTNQVYSLERIGPIKGNIYHKTCFKCLVCDRQLDLKTYYTNQIDLNERQIYCQSHAPKSGKGVFGADNIYIHNVLNAPKLNVMQKCDNKPKANIDGNARHILHAMHAQHLLQMGNRKDGNNQMNYRFPVMPNMKYREEIRKAQEILEAKQRAEEDMLLQKFRDERAKEEEKLDKEVKSEWEVRLQAIQDQYEQDLKRRQDQRDKMDLSQKLRKEQEDLEKNMTLKREKKREDAKRMLIKIEQEATASLVTKHSEEMLKLIKAKEIEVSAGLAGGDDLEKKTSPANARKSITAIQTAINSVSTSPPKPEPPVRRKRDLYDDPNVFEYIDEQAINVAESEQTSYTELVDQLTFGLVTDLEKARAIFRWITVKDLNAIEFGESLTADTPLGLLRGIKFGTETYHTLFMRLCSYAGLHCVDIKGHSKSVGYEPGMKIQPGKFTNTWNAVLIEGEWRFVQCNWGARHLVMSKDKKPEPAVATKPSRDKIKYQYDEHYFLPDPEEFILEFYPHNHEWQLLEQPISLDEFESLPFVRSLFFHYHLDFVNQRQAVIYTNSRGACDIKLRMPDELKSRLAFHFHLRLANREDNEVNGVKLERYVLHTIQDDLVSFNVHVPQAGDYFIEIFASLVEPDANPFGQSFKLKCVCKYKISCEELTQRMHPLPSCASGEWGPMKAQRHFNIIPLTHKNAIIEAGQKTLVELKFELPKLLKIHGKLHNNLLPDLDKNVRYELSGSDPVVLSVFISLPDEGQYGLDIYARDPGFQSEKRTMSHCCKYLINFNKKGSEPNLNKPVDNSDMYSALIGPNSEVLARLGMSALNAADSIVRLDDPPQCELQFKMSKAVDFSFDLKFDSKTPATTTPTFIQMKASEYVRVKQYGYNICFSISLPTGKYGCYLFTVYASDDQNKVRNLPSVYTFLLRYEKKPPPPPRQ